MRKAASSNKIHRQATPACKRFIFLIASPDKAFSASLFQFDIAGNLHSLKVKKAKNDKIKNEKYQEWQMFGRKTFLNSWCGAEALFCTNALAFAGIDVS